jgi:hypothetical protein
MSENRDPHSVHTPADADEQGDGCGDESETCQLMTEENQNATGEDGCCCCG